MITRSPFGSVVSENLISGGRVAAIATTASAARAPAAYSRRYGRFIDALQGAVGCGEPCLDNSNVAEGFLWSIRSQGLDGVDARGAARRDPAGEQSEGEKCQRCGAECHRVCRRDLVQERAQEAGGEEDKAQSEGNAGRRQYHPLAGHHAGQRARLCP